MEFPGRTGEIAHFPFLALGVGEATVAHSPAPCAAVAPNLGGPRGAARLDAVAIGQGGGQLIDSGIHCYRDPSTSPTAASSARTLSRWGTREGSGSTRSLR